MWSNPQDWKLHYFVVKYVQSPLPVYIISSKTNDKIVVQEKEIFWMRTKTERENENPASTKIFTRNLSAVVTEDDLCELFLLGNINY